MSYESCNVMRCAKVMCCDVMGYESCNALSYARVTNSDARSYESCRVMSLRHELGELQRHEWRRRELRGL